MARLPDNIERSAFRHGGYVAYAAGLVWRVDRPDRKSNWSAWPNRLKGYAPRVNAMRVYGATLAEISAKLAALPREANPHVH